MPGKIVNMINTFLDVKVSLVCIGYFMINFAEIDIAMKVITFVLVSAFTIRRWYLMEKRNDDK